MLPPHCQAYTNNSYIRGRKTKCSTECCRCTVTPLRCPNSFLMSENGAFHNFERIKDLIQFQKLWTNLKAAQWGKLEQIIISVFNKFALNHSCRYTNLFLSNNTAYLWNLKKKTNVFWICHSSLYPFTDWLKTHLDSNECLSFWILWGCWWKVKQLTAPVQYALIV